MQKKVVNLIKITIIRFRTYSIICWIISWMRGWLMVVEIWLIGYFNFHRCGGWRLKKGAFKKWYTEVSHLEKYMRFELKQGYVRIQWLFNNDVKIFKSGTLLVLSISINILIIFFFLFKIQVQKHENARASVYLEGCRFELPLIFARNVRKLKQVD